MLKETNKGMKNPPNQGMHQKIGTKYDHEEKPLKHVQAAKLYIK